VLTLLSPSGDDLLPRRAVSGCNPGSRCERPDAATCYQGTCSSDGGQSIIHGWAAACWL